jgi:hypothetical protein
MEFAEINSKKSWTSAYGPDQEERILAIVNPERRRGYILDH